MTEKTPIHDEELKTVAGGGTKGNKKYKKIIALCHACPERTTYSDPNGRTIDGWTQFLSFMACPICNHVGLGLDSYE